MCENMNSEWMHMHHCIAHNEYCTVKPELKFLSLMGALSSAGSRCGCTVSLLQEGTTCEETLKVNQSIAEGATQCCDGVLQRVGLVSHQRRQLRHHPPLSHHLH